MPSQTNSDSSATRGESPTRSPRGSLSLQAAATMNAGLHHDPSRRSPSSPLARSSHSPSSNRRRSQVLMNIQLNDPAVPAPGEMVNDSHAPTNTSDTPQNVTRSPDLISRHSPLMTAGGGDPHHVRTPSLGELHQELEAEQEAQVNRLLAMIRQQQLQLQQLQAQHGQGQSSESAIADSSAPASAHPIPAAVSPAAPSGPPTSGSLPRSPGFPRSSFDMARADVFRSSRTPSRGASPRLRSTSISADSGDQWVLGGRDESAFYQAETQMLVRENQMLRHRVRDLERQLSELNVPGSGLSPSISHEPSQHSHLSRSTTTEETADGSEANTNTTS